MCRKLESCVLSLASCVVLGLVGTAFGQAGLTATNPNPADGATGVTTPILQWSAGATAKFHDVYLGTNPAPGPAEYRGRQPFTMYWHAPGLIPGTTYYWRIDEVEADSITIHTGNVWSFTSAPVTAYNPNPADGAKFVDTEADLSWTEGIGAITHDVYFGTSEADVAAGTGGTFKGNQPTAKYDPGTLVRGTTYYWRIDEVEADGTTKHTGDLWRFKTIPDISITDPNLVGWWKLDEGTGTTALDWSGHNNHGRFVGNPQWMPGYDGDALGFDGSDDYVYIDPAFRPPSYSITLWFRVDGGTGNNRDIFSAYASPGVRHGILLEITTAGVLRYLHRYPLGTGGGNSIYTTTRYDDGSWYHAAMVKQPATMLLYVNGEQVGSLADSTAFTAADDPLGVALGVLDHERALARLFVGPIDDVRIYSKSLAQEEIKQTMRGDPLLAWNPRPANRSTTDIERALPLTWSLGDKAAKHDVYLGTDQTAVEKADASDTTGIYRGRQDANSYTPPEGLGFGKTYYWRIDEFNIDGTIGTGRIWSFTVADYLIVDDFEAYNDTDNRIFDVWADYFVNNTGATVGNFNPPFAEKTIVHSGAQSIPIRYDNDGTVNEGTTYEKTGTLVYSEADCEWAAPQDWTRRGVTSLTLWFRGLPGSVGSFTAGPPIRMTADGADIAGTADQFHFAYKQLSSLGSIQAKVLSVSNTDPWAKAGVMIRETLAAGSTFAAVYITPGNGCRFQMRSATDGSVTSDTAVSTAEQRAIKAPYWVKLERTAGGRFNAYYSSNPASDPWHLMVWSPQTVTMTSDVYIGLALSSHNVNATCVAEFSDVTTTGTVTGQWQSQDIGIVSNAAEGLYVALQDSANKTAVVKHSDPAATTIATWTEWNIALADFTGLNLRAIKKLSIGVGDRANPQRGGSGRLYIDDIQLRLPPLP